jgi:hypothetical protein
MTSLQQTAMGGGDTTAKTVSYVLVAADAGTVVAMNAAGATTITVNTGLFAAGDTVFIQNRGAGTCTVTAGTATVTTHGSLALGQWEGGTLYFTSSSAAIFFDISQSTGMTNPMTTTGDTIYSSSGSTPARLGIGTTGQVLTVAGGIPSWATAAGGGANWSLLNSGGTALISASTVTVSGISGKDKIMVIVSGASATGSNSFLTLGLNGDTGSNYNSFGNFNVINSTFATSQFEGYQSVSDVVIPLARLGANSSSVAHSYTLLSGCNSSGNKIFTAAGGATPAGGVEQRSLTTGGFYNSSSTISSISIINSSGQNWDAGTVYVYTSA